MLLAHGLIELLELLEELRLTFGRNADPRVLDRQPEVVAAGGIDPDGDETTLGRELERVREIVVENLLETRRVHDGRLNLRGDVDIHLEALPLGQHLHRAGHVRDQTGEVHGLRMELHLARLHLREIEDVVHQLFEVAPACDDVAQVFPALAFFHAVWRSIISSENPMIAFSGVRSSCDMLARKALFARLASWASRVWFSSCSLASPSSLLPGLQARIGAGQLRGRPQHAPEQEEARGGGRRKAASTPQSSQVLPVASSG